MRQRLLAALYLLAAAVPLSAQTIFVQDTFTVNANTALESHAPDTGGTWSRVTGNGLTLLAANDNVRNVSNNDYSAYSNSTTAPNAEQVIGITVTFTNPSSNNFVDLFGRSTGGLLTNAYFVRVTSGGSVTLNIIQSGVVTTLASTTMTFATNTPIEIVLSLKNTSKDVYIDGASIVSSTNNTLTSAGITGFGMRGVGSGQVVGDDYYAATFAPTAVERLDATATRDGNRTLVQWTTARELHSVGFRIHRDDGTSSTLIAGAAFLTANATLSAGNSYRWIDERSRKTNRYWIEEIDLDGTSSWHGPIVPRRGEIDTHLPSSAELNSLGQRNGIASRVTLRPASEATSSSRRRTVDPYGRGLARQWDLANDGNAFKVTVPDDGIVRITKSELGDANLESLRLFDNGAELPLGIDGDAVVFYGVTGHVYWLAAVNGSVTRMATLSSAAASATTRTSFLATAERRDKVLFEAALRDPDADGFLGPVVSADAAHPTPQVLRLQHIDTSVPTAKVTVEIQGAVRGDHRVAISLNGNSAGEVSFIDSEIGTATFTVPTSQLVNGDNTINFLALNGDASASAVLSAAITYAHTYQADDDQLLADADGGRSISISGFSTNDIQLFDITATPMRITPSSAANGIVTFTAPGSGSRTILAFTTAKYTRARSVVRNEASTLHTNQPKDLLIISHPSFVDGLSMLVNYRKSENLQVQLVKSEDVYDEYGYGVKSPEAIRNYIRAKRPKYVLLAGDATFDPHNYLGVGDFDFVPTKLVVTDLIRTASDAWFTDLDEDGDADIPIGRFPVRTLADARAISEKIVRLEASNVAAPKNLVFVSDADPELDFHAETAKLTPLLHSGGYTITDIDVSTQGVTAARQQLLGSFNSARAVNYIGHGSVDVWGSTILSGGDASSLVGQGSPFVIAMTCLNGYFHDLYTESLAEQLLRVPNGGASAVFASSALTSPEAQLPVDQQLLFYTLITGFSPGTTPRLGDAILYAQQFTNTPDVRKTFLLFGDPSAHLP